MSTGTQFDMSAVEQLQAGVSTRADAVRLLGAPNAQSTLQDGTELLQWHGSKIGFAGSSIDSQHVALLFAPDGKYLRKTFQHRNSTR